VDDNALSVVHEENIAVCIEIKKIVYCFACEEKMKMCLQKSNGKNGVVQNPELFVVGVFCDAEGDIIGGTECGGNAEKVETRVAKQKKKRLAMVFGADTERGGWNDIYATS
jgi:hypothetical protein